MKNHHPPIKLELGKIYRNLAGQNVVIVYASECGQVFRDEIGMSYYPNGEYRNCERTSWDLYKEMQPANPEDLND